MVVNDVLDCGLRVPRLVSRRVYPRSDKAAM